MPVTAQDHWITTPQGPLFARRWTPATHHCTAPIVLLHDSLGCVALWRDFPAQLAACTGRQVIAYDRLGFGCSAAYPGVLPSSFIDDEAQSGFAAVRQQLGLDRFIVFGHSVGGCMAVGCAALEGCVGLISESAPVFVETLTRIGIRTAEQQFAEPGQLQRLTRYHGDKAEWVLRAWVDTWLSDGFSHWNLDAALAQVRCPVLCLHGADDEFGSTAHPRRLVAQVNSPATLHLLPDCGHVPHRQHPAVVLDSVAAFLAARM